ncbi:hypothetical protein F7725_011272 [Dissostichus mawsoni]|uniref:Clusterin n=1 Tax=Dissostichus mawsoni TaxID=36200 RepID=A0A7J5ZA92_DISMA|nr:hypothetical protein F7725_011272 [Dissostichus mawsoni]
MKLLLELSLDGEKLVDEEVRRALYGVKQMREVMWRNEQKHEHLMKSLRHSSDKKKGADQLTKEVKQKLQEAEQQCKESLQSEWEQCRPCLEDACKTFYTSTCRRGYGFFHAKVENFFRRVSGRFGPKEARLDAGDILVNQGPEDSDMEADRIEESFSSLSSRVGGLVNRSVELVSRMSGRLDQVLQKAFLNYTDSLMEEDTADPYDPARDSSFLQGVGLEDVLESFFDFGKSVVEEFGAVNRKLCRDLRKQTSECWQLQSQCEACQGALLTEQYDEILSIVHHHTDETVNWLSNMAADFSWVAQSVNSNTPENIFSVNVVAPNTQDEQNESETETKVEVNILNSPPIIFSVPGELKLRDPAFIQYVTQEALSKYKEMVRYDEDE